MPFADKFPELWAVACEFSRLVAELDCADQVRAAVERFAERRRADDDEAEFLLPFRSIDRDPGFDELCYAFAALNDGAGLPPIIPSDHALRQTHNVYWLTVGLLRGATSPYPEHREFVTDGWAPAAKALLPRLRRYMLDRTPPAAHSTDFRSVNWFGQSFSFTANQAPVVQLLYENWQAGTPDVGDETLLAAVDPEAPPARIATLFRGHPAWGNMIVAGGSKGTRRLADREPENS